jgi:hypothetical protein
MFVSKKILAGIGVVAVEDEARRERTPQSAQPVESIFSLAVPLDLKLASTCDSDLDLVAFLQLERFYDRRRQADRQTVAPFRYLHLRILQIYMREVYPRR